MLRSTLIAAAAVTAVTTLAVSTAQAADWPTKPVTMVIGYKAGGGTDTVGRVFAKVLSRELGQQVNVVNKPGAGGGVAAMQVARAKNDGYTIMMLPSNSVTSGPHVTKKVRVTVDDFEYAGMLTAFQPALVAPVGAPFNTWDEFLAFAKKKGEVTFATLHPFSRLVGQIIEKEKGIKLNIVPVKGGAGMLNVVLGNEVDLAYSGGIHTSHPDKIKVIAPVTSDRQAATPDIPTLREQGIPVAANAMTTLFAPKGTSDAIMNKLAAAVKVASTDPSVIDISNKTKFPLHYRDRKATTEEMKAQWDSYKAIIEATGYVAK
ncbi:MAG: tripartite tricarboxylate transporter substrate binding protein [Burkholderiaceae bacterium]